jgi:hypothetical protein
MFISKELFLRKYFIIKTNLFLFSPASAEQAPVTVVKGCYAELRNKNKKARGKGLIKNTNSA